MHLYLEVRQSPGRGRGVWATAPIAAGTMLEESPVIVMSAADRAHLDQTLLHDYIFEWQPDGQQLCCMALGYVPLYNHACPSNSEYLMDYDHQTIRVVTMRDIAAGEEVTINYQGDFDDATPVWFELA